MSRAKLDSDPRPASVHAYASVYSENGQRGETENRAKPSHCTFGARSRSSD